MSERQIDALPIARVDGDSCKALKAAASTEEERPILNYLLVREGFVEATNGKVLCRVPLVDAAGEEFSLPVDMRGKRYLVHRSVLDHVRGSHSLEIDMMTGECWVVGTEGEEGYPIQLPPADIETEGMRYPNTDAVVPRKKNGHREIMLGAPILKAMLAFAGSGKKAGSLHLLIPEEDVTQGHVTTPVLFSKRGGDTARSGLVMPMRIMEGFEQVGEDEAQAEIAGTEQPETPA